MYVPLPQLHPLLKLEVEEPVEIDDVTVRCEVVKAQAEREQEEKLAFLVRIFCPIILLLAFSSSSLVPGPLSSVSLFAFTLAA